MNTPSRTLPSVIACVTGAAGAAAEIVPPAYRVSVLSDVAGTGQSVSYPRAISPSGLAVGYTWEVGKPARAWAWDGSGVRNLPAPPGMPGAWTYAHAVNAEGVVAGTIEYAGRAYGALWRGGEVTLLSPLNDGDSASAYAINDSGVATGGSWPGGILWRDGAAAPLPLLSDAAYGSAFLVNNSGTFAGYAGRPGERAYAARWTDKGGEWLELPAEPSDAHALVGTQLTGMNQRGDIIGWTTRYGFTGSGQLWRADGELVELGNFDPQKPGLIVPSGINDATWVVGHRSGPGGEYGAFLWIDGAMFDLATLLDGPYAGIDLEWANAINNDGVILATAVVGGRQVPVLLTPVPSPAGVAALGALAALVIVRRRR